MAEELFGLTPEQFQRVAQVVRAVEHTDQPSPQVGGRRKLYASRLIVGALVSSVQATTALLGKPKTGTLNVYEVSSTGVVDTGVTETVYNLAPQAATTDRWAIAERDDWSGKYILTTQFCS